MSKNRKATAGSATTAKKPPSTPVETDREKARRAADNIIAMSKGMTLGGLKIKDLINEGRE